LLCVKRRQKEVFATLKLLLKYLKILIIVDDKNNCIDIEQTF